MLINGIEIKGVIFDLDGTLLDSATIWYEIDYEFFKKRGMEVPDKYGSTIGPMGLIKAARYTKDMYLPNEDENDILKEWLDASANKYATEVRTKEYAKEFLEYLNKNNIPCVVCTANAYECFMPCLINNGVDKYFKDFLYVDKHGPKSDIKIFNAAAKVLGTKPEETLVIDDLFMPLSVVRPGGFKTCGIVDRFSNQTDDFDKYCDMCITSFKELL